jgi:ribosomal protein L7Ae-like RNA K-turn-binding protein
MDIADLSIMANQSSLSTAVGIALTKKVMDVSQVNASQLIKDMKQSSNPNIGSNLDVIA